MWDHGLPSPSCRWAHGRASSTRASSAASMSPATFVAPSPAAWTRTPAVVWGTNSVTRKPSSDATSSSSCAVTFTSCVFRPVWIVSSGTKAFSPELVCERDELGRVELFGARAGVAADRLERVREPLAPVGERGRDDLLHAHGV